MSDRVRTFPVRRAGGLQPEELDSVAIEEPLEIRVQPAGEEPTTVAVTMRTPGDDAELALGLLFCEGVISSASDCVAVTLEPADWEPSGTVTAALAEAVEFDAGRLSRHLLTGSSCGVCGRATLDMLWQAGIRPFAARLEPEASLLAGLPERMREEQAVFSQTGGTHAAALFDLMGNLLELREDIGRHNAVDKVVGALLQSERLPASETILAVSGRASYELVQKALCAGIPCLAAVGAPSSLAVELASEFRMALVGFLGKSGGNVYLK